VICLLQIFRREPDRIACSFSGVATCAAFVRTPLVRGRHPFWADKGNPARREGSCVGLLSIVNISLYHEKEHGGWVIKRAARLELPSHRTHPGRTNVCEGAPGASTGAPRTAAFSPACWPAQHGRCAGLVAAEPHMHDLGGRQLGRGWIAPRVCSTAAHPPDGCRRVTVFGI